MARLKTIEWKDGNVSLIDQTKLPGELVYTTISTIEEMYNAIKTLMVRGAPAIGIAAGFGLYLGIRDFPDNGKENDFFEVLKEKSDYLNSSRPTAVNLSWALHRIKNKVQRSMINASIAQLKQVIMDEAFVILDEDRAICRQIGENGYEILKNCSSILTHCNAGGLATSEYGTALAPVYVGLEKGKNFTVYSDETRPLLQGSRITAFELTQAGVDVIVICDNMAAYVMSLKKVDAVIVGADRITANGDTANKIGTYGLAISAAAHNVPFYVAAPVSTFDFSLSDGSLIPIEERESEEITCAFGKRTAPEGVKTFNPAFDVTPSRLIAGIITERGVVYPPFAENIKRMLH